MELPDPPEGWQLDSLINHSVVGGEPRWLVRMSCRHSYVGASGTSPIYAMQTAIAKIEEGDVFEKLSGMTKGRDLTKLLGVPTAKTTIMRRL